mmetsp:Transcript_23827/g.64275  ORF Transcript_23827/g.64275 Transcript_23827/m.64275 type:complete len:111 (-) Transcript_23827:80-412(-)
MRVSEDGEWKQSESTPLNLLCEYEVSRAHCYDPNEEHSLRTVIHAVGEARFNQSIKGMGEAVLEQREREKRAADRKMRKKSTRGDLYMSTHTGPSMIPSMMMGGGRVVTR